MESNKSSTVESEFSNDVEKISSMLKNIEDVALSLFVNEYIQESLYGSSPSNDVTL